MLRPVRLVPEPTSRAVVVSGGTIATASSSGVGASVPSPISGADAWHVGPLGHYLKGKRLIRLNTHPRLQHALQAHPGLLVFCLHFQTVGSVQYTRPNIIS